MFLIIGMQAPAHASRDVGMLSVAEHVYSLWNHPLFDLATILIGAAIGWLRYRRQAHLLMYGRAAIASVTGFDRRLWMVIFRRRNRVKCEFRLLNGSFCTAEVEIPPRGSTPDIDSELVIVYDRDQPKRAVLYPARNLKVTAK
jgi:hypothetical protein